METITQINSKDYNAMLAWVITLKCNFACKFCHLTPEKGPMAETLQGSGKRVIRKILRILKKDISEIKVNICRLIEDTNSKLIARRGININALSKTLEKTGKIFMICFTGGEPFLVPNIIELCIELTKKNYISMNTNLTSPKIKLFADKINPKRTASIFASLHIKELERYNLTDRYIDNFMFCRARGFNIEAVEVGYPSLLKEVEKYREFFRKKGLDIRFQIFFGSYKGKLYPEAYTEEERKIFDLNRFMTEKYYHKQGELCNAGYNVASILPSGDAVPCSSIPERIGNIYKSINFKKKLTVCPFARCGCPVNRFDDYLFKKALEETQILR